jgi:hypothetical protein
VTLSELLKDVVQVAVQKAFKLEKKLKDKQFMNEIKTVLNIAKKGFSDSAGNALHRLDETNPSIDSTVKKLIQGFPDSPLVSFENEEGQLPIQSAVWNNEYVNYVPILAKVGIKHEVGGRGTRGGLLLLTDPRKNRRENYNTLSSCLHEW